VTDGAQVPDQFEQWYRKLHRYTGDFPAKGTISGALVVLDRLKRKWDLDIDAHTAVGGAQIVGASGGSVARILAEFGETRPFVSEGGRTNRGLRGDIKSMLDALRLSSLDRLPPEERLQVLSALQEFLVRRVRDLHNRERLRFVYNPAQSTRQTVQDLLSSARETRREGPVAQYLVGAKLQLRFPDQVISNESYSTADVQLDRLGDFHIGSTVFHVTVAPMPAVYQKCVRNLDAGYRPYLLVPETWVVGARQLAEGFRPGQIAVESIETFVAQNVDELGRFSKQEVGSALRALLETYNRRVDAAEFDKSLLMDIPPNL
jgi:hypothetical protein